jgi:ribosomal protein S18 acetylase RimI-like enzyme
LLRVMKSPDMHFRRYLPADFEALYAIEEACFEPPHRFGRRYMRKRVDAADSATWIAEEIAEPALRMAGFAIVAWSRRSGAQVAYIETIEVLPEFRGRGAARELLRRMESSALEAGAETILLHVDAGNRPAIALYQAGGYLCKGQVDHYYGRGRAGLVYAKPLDPATLKPLESGPVIKPGASR